MRTTRLMWIAVSALFVGAGCVEPVPTNDYDAEPGEAAIKVVAAAVDAPALDVWVDGERLIGNVEPGEVAPEVADEYFVVPSGVTEIAFTRFGDKLEDAVFARPFVLAKDAHYTLYTYGSLAGGMYTPFGAEVVYDDRPCADGVSCARLGHAANRLGAVDVWLYADPSEGWVRTDKYLTQGEVTWRPLDVDQGVVCGIGFARAGARGPEIAFPYKAPAGEHRLFLTDAGASWFMNHNYPDRARAVVLDDLHRMLAARGTLADVGARTEVPALAAKGLKLAAVEVEAHFALPEVQVEEEVPFWDRRRFEGAPLPVFVGMDVDDEVMPPVWRFDDELLKLRYQTPAVEEESLPPYRLMVVGPSGTEMVRPMEIVPIPRFDNDELPFGEPTTPVEVPWWPEPFDPSYPQ